MMKYVVNRKTRNMSAFVRFGAVLVLLCVQN